MKKLSKIAAILAALVMACAVTGCSGGEEESSNNGSPNENSGTNGSGTSGENKEITYSDSKNATLETWSSSKVYKFSGNLNKPIRLPSTELGLKHPIH